ncbi:hypothetical protein [Treponema pedis]|uniref:hypothetical protein n=1 Tax=Treponema pedis TaxID=409322 RepID=UPI0031420F86
MKILKTFFFCFLIFTIANCGGINNGVLPAAGGAGAGQGAGSGGGETSPTVDLVGGYVAKSWYTKPMTGITTNIDYNATINDTPVIQFLWKYYSDNKYIFLTNFDITKPEDFDQNLRVWHIYLHPAEASKNKVITYLAKYEDEPSQHEKNLKVLKIEVVDNKYFDPEHGKPLHLRLTVEKYGEVVIRGVKK